MIPLYIGTYTEREPHVDGKGQGIYLYQMDPATGELEYRALVSGLINPSYMSIAESKGCLYTVNEITAGNGNSGMVSAMSINALTADLTFLNQQSTRGLSPCHLSACCSERYLLVANYVSGSVCVLPIQADGSLGEATHVVHHVGSGPHSQRQSSPHVHMVTPDPDGRFIIVVDLGTDEIVTYRLDVERGKLLPAGLPATRLPPGTGPRHLRFHPNGRVAYVVGELNSTVCSLGYDPGRGSFHLRQTVSTLPEDFDGRNSGAEIQVHFSGKYVYASNRGHDSIAIFAVDEQSGSLSLLGHAPSDGMTPRYFTIDPAGDFLLVANQDSSQVVTLRINQDTGELQTCHSYPVPTPVCIKFYPTRQNSE